MGREHPIGEAYVGYVAANRMNPGIEAWGGAAEVKTLSRPPFAGRARCAPVRRRR